jgi:hypothetical protein
MKNVSQYRRQLAAVRSLEQAHPKQGALMYVAHGRGYTHVDVSVKQSERAAALSRFEKLEEVRESDPEKEAMKQELAVLRSAVNDITTYLHQVAVQQTPSVSFLDEMLASLEQKQDAVAPIAVPQSILDALSSDE